MENFNAVNHLRHETADGSGTDNFLDKLIQDDIKRGTFTRGICTRFPPEPNGYLHIGSAYAIHLNYGIARKYGGEFHLRFDDTNPLKEDAEYVEAIREDLEWLGTAPGKHVYYGSDYSGQIYACAVRLIERGKAYVCDLSPDELYESRGTLTSPGTDSPYRERSPEENLRLFAEMRSGRNAAGSRVLRAKIDMSSPNVNLRDPVLYRIIHAEHYRTGNEWCIYPMYDFAHPIQDAIEGITHSLCSIEFKDHRPLYEWVLRELEMKEPPRQWEFGRVNLTGVVTSKRYLRELVAGGHVDGWDDPRLPTLRGMRRRGFTPESIAAFVKEIGLARQQTVIDIGMLEHALRQDLNGKAQTAMVVLHPLKVVIDNYPEGETEWLEIENNPEQPEAGKRKVPFSRTIFIERDDFAESPPKGFRRLVPGGEVRLKGAYFLRCVEVVRDAATGEIAELRCTYDPLTKSGSGFEGRKVKGTIHWVSAGHAVQAEVRLFEPLLLNPGARAEEAEEPPAADEADALLTPEAADAGDSGTDGWAERLNPRSLTVLQGCLAEPALIEAGSEAKFQFLRHGYFCEDSRLSNPGRPVYNRIVSLKDGWKGK